MSGSPDVGEDAAARAPEYPFWLEPASAAAAFAVGLLARTWRIEVERAPEYEAASEAGERFVYAFWHSHMLPLVWVRRGEGVAVLVSRHRDGQLITRVIERLGYTSARGSSTRGGETGVRELLAWAAKGRHIAVTPDGPRGPARHVKEGLAYLAVRTRRRIVPIGAWARSSWVFRSWDRFRAPRPFAHVAVVYGAPQAVAGTGEAEREMLDRALDDVTSRAARLAGDAP